MIIDSALIFSKDQVISSDTASTNYIDLGSLKNIGLGTPVAVVVGFNSIASGTIKILVQTDDNTSFSSPVVLLSTETISPPAGSKVVFTLPALSPSERYIRLYYDVTISSGSYTIDAFLTQSDMVEAITFYPPGYTIV